MAQVPAAPDAGVLAARLDGVQSANVDAVAPAPTQPAVQEPQAVNPDQPAQGQPHEAQQAPEVCFLSFWVFACISPPCFFAFPVQFWFLFGFWCVLLVLIGFCFIYGVSFLVLMSFVLACFLS